MEEGEDEKESKNKKTKILKKNNLFSPITSVCSSII